MNLPDHKVAVDLVYVLGSKFSVATPSYNQDRYTERTVRSGLFSVLTDV